MDDLFSSNNNFVIDFSDELTQICHSFRLPENVFFWECSITKTKAKTFRLLIKENPYPFSQQIKPLTFLVLTIMEKNLVTKTGRWEVYYNEISSNRKKENILYNEPERLKEFVLKQSELSLKNYKSSLPLFGCCSKWEKCANEERCIHENLLYATSCQYRQNLENSNNFYKKG